MFDKIQNKKVDVEEKANKRGHVQYQALSVTPKKGIRN